MCQLASRMSRTLNLIVAGKMVGCEPLRPMHESWTSLVAANESPISWILIAHSERIFRQGVKMRPVWDEPISVALFHFRAQYCNAFQLKRKESLWSFAV